VTAQASDPAQKVNQATCNIDQNTTMVNAGLAQASGEAISWNEQATQQTFTL
jgi:hypothetical protein